MPRRQQGTGPVQQLSDAELRTLAGTVFGRERPEAFSDELRASLELGNFYTGVQYVQVQRMRRALTEQTVKALVGFDAMVMPTSPVPATPIEPDPPGHVAVRSRNTLPFDFISLPAISVPCGFTAAGACR